MNARPLGAIRPPLLALCMIPKRTIQFPGLAVVLRLEQTSRHRSAPNQARLIGATRRKCPDEFESPVERLIKERDSLGHIPFGHRRILRSSNLSPCFAAVG